MRVVPLLPLYFDFSSRDLGPQPWEPSLAELRKSIPVHIHKLLVMLNQASIISFSPDCLLIRAMSLREVLLGFHLCLYLNKSRFVMSAGYRVICECVVVGVRAQNLMELWGHRRHFASHPTSEHSAHAPFDCLGEAMDFSLFGLAHCWEKSQTQIGQSYDASAQLIFSRVVVPFNQQLPNQESNSSSAAATDVWITSPANRSKSR